MNTKNVIMRALRVGMALFVIHWLVTAASPAAETITVSLKSGRVLTAHVDARSDAARLWLRFDGPSTSLYRPIAWDRLIRATIAGQTLTSQELREGLDAWKSTRPKRTAPPRVERPKVHAKTAGSGTQAQWAAEALRSQPFVAAIEVDAAVAHWDADVEVDGIVLRLAVRDAHGNRVSVTGVVDATLHATRFIKASDVPGRNGRRIENMGHWKRSVHVDDAGEIVLRLPFEAVHPEFQRDVASFGLLTVQLTAPGHGVFHATVQDVRIRPFSLVRDEIQHATGRRFLPNERTSR
jgi:hypothetical protein